MGMGMGFRSVPPTGLPHATLKPGQTRHLPTQLFSLRGPAPDGRVALPAKGERLTIGDIGQVNDDPWVRVALKRLAEDKAPPTVAQLVLWHVHNGLSWETIAQFSRGWANAEEMALARSFVRELRDAQGRELPRGESGKLYWELTTRKDENAPVAADLKTVLDGRSVLGLAAKKGVPARPEGPSLAVRIRLEGDEAFVRLDTPDLKAGGWSEGEKFVLKLKRGEEPLSAAEVADALAEKILTRLLDVRLIPGGKYRGKSVYKIRIENRSPLILNALVLAGTESGEAAGRPSLLAGLSLPPHKGLTVPTSTDVVERLGLKEGLRVLAVDLSGL
ncbi:MAG: hypothetical protein IRY99_21555 [Isosphaeraceae bacterium]|nr:hypothetical protein [Isosphaeraceae bacterium]